ncbi:MAG: universal stress protein [Actinomycetota bacterium]|nr:universal stress protein [Actinomycetota bacterium]
MAKVLCAVDESKAATAAVAAAIEFSRKHDLDLRLVGIVRPVFGVTQPAYGEQVRRFREVEFALVQAARAAREAGLKPGIGIRAGYPEQELVREAEATGAGDIFLGRTRGLVAATLRRRPRLDVLRVTQASGGRRETRRYLEEAA